MSTPGRLAVDSFTAHAFRGLREVTLSDCRRINVLVGPNNSGKTSVLEGISLLGSACSPLAWHGLARAREYAGSRRRRVFEELLWGFPAERPELVNGETPSLTAVLAGPVQVSAQGAVDVGYTTEVEERQRIQEDDKDIGAEDLERGLWIRVSVDPRPAAADATDGNASGGIEAGQPPNAEYTFWEHGPWEFPLWRWGPSWPHIVTWPADVRTEAADVKFWSSLDADGQASVTSLLRSFDAEIASLQIVDPTGSRSQLVVEHGRLGRVPLSVFGDGLRRALQLSLVVAPCRDGVLLIDEIESSIHRDALVRVFRWLVDACRAENVQIFATTHSLEAVDALLEAVGDDLDDLAAFHLRREGEQVVVGRYDGELLERLVKRRGLDVR